MTFIINYVFACMCFEKLIDVPKIRKFTNSQGKAVFVAVNNTAEAFESDLDD